MQEHLANVTTAMREREAAQRGLLDALRDAVAAGVPQAKLAEVVGVNRVTLWRWLHDEPDTGSDRRCL